MKLRTILFGIVASVPVVLVTIGAEPLVEYLARWPHVAVFTAVLGAALIVGGLAGIAVGAAGAVPGVDVDQLVEPDEIDLELFALLDAEATRPCAVRVLVEPAPWEVRR